MKELCIYHGNCADGFGGALVLYMFYGKEEVEFHPGVYQEPPPDIAGRDVILVDFSYKREVLIEMADKAKSIVILDHHQSAQEELINLPDNVEAYFDMSKSGAVMAWKYYFPALQIPQLFLHIQDRDLWTFKLAGTREIQACLFSYPYTFELWEKLLHTDLSDLYKEGTALLRKHMKDVTYLIKRAAYTDTLAGYEVPFLNAPYMYSSDAGHIMGKDKPFAVCYYETKDARIYSLRSSDTGVDVAKIATSFGGGGHKHAAGFTIKKEVHHENNRL